MASAWGASWGSAWGASWGALVQAVVGRRGGGSQKRGKRPRYWWELDEEEIEIPLVEPVVPVLGYVDLGPLEIKPRKIAKPEPVKRPIGLKNREKVVLLTALGMFDD